jgi:putative MATE family efflux protein
MLNILTKKESSVFYKTMLGIALPIALQSLIGTTLNMVDTVMIGSLGEAAIAAVGIANRVFFFYALCVFGTYSGMSIFTSQYWGVKDTLNIRRIMGIMISIGSILGIIFTLLAALIPNHILSIFINDKEVIALGSSYLRIICASYIITAISFAFNYASRSVHKTKLPMVVSAVALLTNTFLNYTLIYGNFGFSAMGVKGAAIATVSSRILELFLLIFFIYKNKDHPLAGKFSEMFSYSREMVQKVIKTAFPVFINESTWALGTTVYYIAYGYLGKEAVAAVQITYTISDFFQALFMGLGNATAVMIGNEIGKRNKDLAYRYGKQFLTLSSILAVIISFAIFLLRPVIINFFNIGPTTQAMLFQTLFVVAIYLLPKMFTYVMIVGVLRSGGDTKFCMIIDLLGVWLIGVPLAFIGVKVLHYPVHLIIALVFFEEALKCIITLPRFKSKKWIRRLID